MLEKEGGWRFSGRKGARRKNHTMPPRRRSNDGAMRSEVVNIFPIITALPCCSRRVMCSEVSECEGRRDARFSEKSWFCDPYNFTVKDFQPLDQSGHFPV